MFGNSFWPRHRLHLCSAVVLCRFVNRGHCKTKILLFLFFGRDCVALPKKQKKKQKCLSTSETSSGEDCVLRDQILKSTTAATRSLYSILTATVQTYMSISLYDVAGDAVLHCKQDTNLHMSGGHVTGSNYMNHKPSICCSNWSPLITQSDRLWSALSSCGKWLQQELKSHQLFETTSSKDEAFPVFSLPRICSSYRNC